MKKYDVYIRIGNKVHPMGDVIASGPKAAISKRVQLAGMPKGVSFASARRSGEMFAVAKSANVNFKKLEKKIYG